MALFQCTDCKELIEVECIQCPHCSNPATVIDQQVDEATQAVPLANRINMSNLTAGQKIAMIEIIRGNYINAIRTCANLLETHGRR